jgi:hypothetical protein
VEVGRKSRDLRSLFTRPSLALFQTAADTIVDLSWITYQNSFDIAPRAQAYGKIFEMEFFEERIR